MADLEDVQTIVLALPETIVEPDLSAFSVTHRGKRKNIAWLWLERLHPKKGRVPNREVLAVRVQDLEEKEMLLDSNPTAIFTEPHYAGYPAVLIRLAAIELDELRALIVNAWRCQAPRALVKTFDQQQRA
ncbi:MAG: hypothetical protein KF893_17245 [Caldilineaceae bacterium]|nr:hypothetical protein [Caldilineaceae bacterium]